MITITYGIVSENFKQKFKINKNQLFKLDQIQTRNLLEIIY